MDRSDADMIVDFARTYQVCRECGFVDRDQGRLKVGYKCSVCGVQSEGGLMFLELNVLVLIRQIYEAYYFSDTAVEESYMAEPEEFKDLAVVVFFCILKEVLLERFLLNFMHVLNLPEGVMTRMESDNDSHRRRLENLFPSLTGQKWKDVLSKLPSNDPKKYNILDELLLRATKARNELLHEANHHSITSKLAEECFNAIPVLLDCYKHLNNIYVHPVVNAAR
jgi:hypothetical protein